jgi:Predicted transcriptional regulators
MDAILASEYVSIGELVRITGCRYSTLKFYTEENMLPFEQAEQNLTRRYRREETVERIQWIKKLKENGLSIPQIKNVLQTAPKKESDPS